MASLILFISLLSASLPLSVYSSGGFSVDLIHRDSPNSPFYNPSLSPFDRRRAAAHRSITRANYLRSLTSTSPSSIQSEAIYSSGEYLMTIYVGTPPLKVLAIADTGSDLIWTQCKPCIKCYKQKDPIFDTASSSTYGSVTCKADSCSPPPEFSCGEKSDCQYRYTYGDKSYTEGVLSSETFTFDSDNKEKVSVPKVLFGCSHESDGIFDENGGGLVGLGGGPLSLVSQLGSSINNKFSYCLVPYADNSNSSSLLNFGDKADVGPNAVTTPIITQEDDDTFYYLDLVSISVGNEKVAFKKKPETKGNIIIDSGTTLTMLDKSMLQRIVNKLAQIVKYPKMRDPNGTYDLCFDVSGTSSWMSGGALPELTFEFSGAAVKLPVTNTFEEVKEGMVCLLMLPTEKNDGKQIFGNTAQQNLHVEYDLGARKLSIAHADCAKLYRD